MTLQNATPGGQRRGGVLQGSDAAAVDLRRGLALPDSVMLVVGSMVGSGIFLTTGQIAGTLPVPWLILLAWVIGGGMALAGALTYAELGASLPRAGGHYVYLREAYGPLVGFLDGWFSFVASFPGSIAFMALGLVTYLPGDLSGHAVFHARIFGLGWTVKSAQLLAIAAILLLSLINALGLRAGKSTQNLLSGLNILTLVALGGLGLLSRGGLWSHFFAQGLPAAGPPGVKAMGLALIGVSFAYLGWDASTYMAAEVRSPQRNIPKSLALGTLVVIGLYVLFNAALLYVIPVAQMPGSQNVSGDIVSRLFGPGLRWLASIAILVCIFSSLNATVMVGPRIYYAMAKDGLFPRALSVVSRTTGVPVRAIAAQAVWASIIVLSATLGRILAFTVLVIWLLSAITGAAVFVLRVRHPGAALPYRTWGYPWVPALFCLSSLALAANHLANTASDLLWLVGFLLAGLPVYAFFLRISRQRSSRDSESSSIGRRDH